jgi:hypothetical protein
MTRPAPSAWAALGAVGLIASDGQDDERNALGECFFDAVEPAVGQQQRTVWQQRYPGKRGLDPDVGPNQPFHDSDYALHWDGKGWRKSRFPMTFEVTQAADFGRRDVWAFGEGRYVARYNGRSWRKASVPVAPLALSALSATDIWAIGPTARNRLAAVNWNGRRWQPVPLPRLSRAGAPGNLDPGDITATGPGDLWWTYRPSSGSRSVRLLHYQNRHWTTIAVPGQVTDFGPITPDGRGGVWMVGEAGYGLNEYWYHYNDGRWGRRSVIAPRGYNLTIFGSAWVPGTTSVWAVGEADKNYAKSRGPMTEAVIARYGN